MKGAIGFVIASRKNRNYIDTKMKHFWEIFPIFLQSNAIEDLNPMFERFDLLYESHVLEKPRWEHS